MKDISILTKAEEAWKIYGSFGFANGLINIDGNNIISENDKYIIKSQRQTDEHGVTAQTGTIKNISNDTMTVNCLMSRFLFEGGEYDVYTQSNIWLNESTGAWQPLVTEVSAQTMGLRNAYGMAPFVAIWDKQTQRGTAFHILTRSAWQLNVKREPTILDKTIISVELGYNSCNFFAQLKSGEELEIPQIIYYEFRNKQDMDCYKLHHYINNTYPRRELPIIYNTWLYKFEKITFENVFEQISPAKELGAEYFVIDAGWFGSGDFWRCRGDWEESIDSGFCGKMKQISDAVRENGMKFGLWLEVETAGADSKALKEHKDLYFEYEDIRDTLYFLDFANPKACQYILDKVEYLIEKYSVKFIKFDFNQDLKEDMFKMAHLKYFEGYSYFLGELRKHHPDLYIEDCASGGLRVSLETLKQTDASWLSDNLSPYEGLEMFKNVILRMPPQAIEKWISVQSITDFKHKSHESETEKIISINDAMWRNVRGVDISYLKGFLCSGPIGISCDVKSLSKNVFEELKCFVAEYKKERAFWEKAVCRILSDTESVLILEFSDIYLDDIRIFVFSKRIRQENFLIYPKVDFNAEYCIDNDKRMSGSLIDEKGLLLNLFDNYKMKQMRLKKQICG